MDDLRASGLETSSIVSDRCVQVFSLRKERSLKQRPSRRGESDRWEDLGPARKECIEVAGRNCSPRQGGDGDMYSRGLSEGGASQAYLIPGVDTSNSGSFFTTLRQVTKVVEVEKESGVARGEA